MRCPKCHYLSFDPDPRCKNCGYDLDVEVEGCRGGRRDSSFRIVPVATTVARRSAARASRRRRAQ